MLWQGGFGAVFPVAIPATGSASAVCGGVPDHIAVKSVFNFGMRMSKLETMRVAEGVRCAGPIARAPQPGSRPVRVRLQAPPLDGRDAA